MKLTILGGGGFRVPLVYAAVLGQRTAHGVREVALHDTDESRLRAIGHVLAEQAQRHTAASEGPPPAKVTATTSLDEALDGADFVFSAIRVGGLEGRVVDERLALDLGLLGSLYVGHRVARSLTVRPSDSLKAVAPWALLILILFAAGVWIVLQPMQMRGTLAPVG